MTIQQAWPYPWSEADHCYFHNRPEPFTADDFQVCGECWHVYRTAKELIDAHEAIEGDRPLAGQIWCCPLCIHDF